MKELKELRTDYEAKNQRVNAILDQHGDEDMPKEALQELDRLEKEIGEIEQEIKDRNDSQETVRAARDRAKGRDSFLNDPSNRLPQAKAQGERGKRGIKTIGDLFVEAKEIAEYLKTITLTDGRINEKARIQSPAVEVKTLITGASATSAGAFTNPDHKETVNAAPFRPLSLRDLISQGTTGSDTVDYVRINSWTNAAAPTAEASATGDGSGAAPESAMAFAQITELVRSIPHWIPMTKRALADAGQVKTMIDNFLRYGVEEELEDQIVNGAGTGENFTGILNTTGTQTQAWDTDLLTTIRKARTKAKTPGRITPNGVLMNPADWEKIDLLKDNEERYYFGGPSVLGNPRIWGLPVIESEAIAAGTAILADFRYAQLWDREAATITLSDSHSDFFIRRMVAVLAELRAAFGVLYPKAFVEVATVAP